MKEILDRLQEAITKESDTDFLKACNGIAQKAKTETESEIAILYLTADQKILEAVGVAGDPLEALHPMDIPFYRLDWDIIPGYEHLYDGWTAWLALHLKPNHFDVRTSTATI